MNQTTPLRTEHDHIYPLYPLPPTPAVEVCWRWKNDAGSKTERRLRPSFRYYHRPSHKHPLSSTSPSSQLIKAPICLLNLVLNPTKPHNRLSNSNTSASNVLPSHVTSGSSHPTSVGSRSTTVTSIPSIFWPYLEEGGCKWVCTTVPEFTSA
jgi:hypothetical protein